MKRKKAITGAVLSIIFSATSVSAQAFRDSFGPFWDLIDYLFNYLPNNSSTQGAYFKFLLWILFFSVYVVVIKKLFPEESQRKQRNAIAIILSLMTTLLMPNKILVALFTSYTYLGALVLTFALPIILIVYTRGMDYRVRAGSQILGGIFLVAFTPTFWSEFTQPWTKTLSSFMSVGGFALLINGFLGLTNQGQGIFGRRGNKTKDADQVINELKSLGVDSEESPEKIKDEVEKKLKPQRPLKTLKNELRALTTTMQTEARDLENLNNFLVNNGPIERIKKALVALEKDQNLSELRSGSKQIFKRLREYVNPIERGILYLGRVENRQHHHYKKINEAVNQLTFNERVFIGVLGLGYKQEVEQFKEGMANLRAGVKKIESAEENFVSYIGGLSDEIQDVRSKFNNLKGKWSKTETLKKQDLINVLADTEAFLSKLLTFRQPVVQAFSALKVEYEEIGKEINKIVSSLQVLSDGLLVKLADKISKREE